VKIDTVEGELGVASFLFLADPFPDLCDYLKGNRRAERGAELAVYPTNILITPPILPSSISNPAGVSAFVSANMAP
jgi:hypothetical protein